MADVPIVIEVAEVGQEVGIAQGCARAPDVDLRWTVRLEVRDPRDSGLKVGHPLCVLVHSPSRYVHKTRLALGPIECAWRSDQDFSCDPSDLPDAVRAPSVPEPKE